MHFKYRPDIQGLRAIAVLLVFFSHAHWSPFSGGFVGVDVFFVISGYVITRLLLKEYDQNRRITLNRFYARRLQRLLPALAFMLLLSTLISLFIFTPYEQLFQSKSAISASLWLSNIYFLYSDLDYFGRAATESLFLHTWSLGVEEQFYLMWPFIILIGVGHFSRGDRTPNLASILLLTLCVSAMLSFALAFTSPKHAFYLMPPRSWQFALGALVAYSQATKTKGWSCHLSPLVSEWVALTGFLMILLGAMYYDNTTPYPNWQVSVPTIGTALMLLAYRHGKATFIGKTLSLQPIRWFGDVSYSFYLWHWPILLFCERLRPIQPSANTLFALGLTIMMATFSYYVIENRIRKDRRLLAFPKYAVWGSAFVMVFTCTSLYTFESYSDRQYSDPMQQKLASVRYTLPVLYKYGCDEWYTSTRVRQCAFGDKSSEKKAVIIGDSMLLQLFPAIVDHYTRRNWQLIVLTKSSCPMVNRPYFYTRINSIYHTCDIWRERAIQAITELKPQVVIMGSSSRYPFSRIDWLDGTREIIEQLLPVTAQIYLIAGTPSLGFDGPSCLARHAWLSKTFPIQSAPSCSRKLHLNESLGWLGEVATEYQKVQFIDLSDTVCPKGICSAKIDDWIVYRDFQHLTVEFVSTLKEHLGAQLSRENIL